MIQNTNHKAVINIAKKSFKVNKTRNIFAILAIALTTVLFTTLFTIGTSIIKSQEYSRMRTSGSNAHGVIKSLTSEEYEKLKKHKSIKESGASIYVATAENKEFAKRQVQIKWADEVSVKNQFVDLIKGKVPEKENEVMVDTTTLDMLKAPHDINQTISINYSIMGKKYTKDFLVCGVFKGDKVKLVSEIYVSQNFIKEDLKNVDQKLSKKNHEYTGLINMEVKFSNSFNIEKKLLKIIEDSGYSKEDIGIGVNWAYATTDMEEQLNSILSIGGFILLIMLSGYLIIYNIFYISVVRDTKFYGLLKTIGTTKKQIKKIIKRQALILSAIGIPLGILLGYIIGIILVPFIMRILTIEYTTVSVNPIIFIGAAFFSLMTVYISCYKPVKIASTISPIEAVRYTGVSENIGKKYKKSYSGAKIHKMALSNIFRSKRKAIMVITSLSISILLLNSVYTIVSNVDLDKFLKDTIVTDFTIGDTSFYTWSFGNNKGNAVTENVCKQIEDIDEVESMSKIYYKEFGMPTTKNIEENIKKNMDSTNKTRDSFRNDILNKKKIKAGYYGLDSKMIEHMKPYIIKGNFDLKKFSTGEYVILGRNVIGDICDIGDNIKVQFPNNKSKEYKVMAIVDELPMYIYVGYSFPGTTIYGLSSEYLKYIDDPSIMTAMFNVKEGYDEYIQNYISSLTKNNPSLDYRSKASYKNEFYKMTKTITTVGYSLTVVIGLIGILNFVNVITTSIISRKRELAMLRSIGMTQKQLIKMLVMEGIYHILITIAIVIFPGQLLTYLGVNTLASGVSFFSYSFKILPVILCLPILVITAIIIPVMSYRDVSKTSIIENLSAF